MVVRVDVNKGGEDKSDAIHAITENIPNGESQNTHIQAEDLEDMEKRLQYSPWMLSKKQLKGKARVAQNKNFNISRPK